jgi:hypothetical protein
MKLYDIIRETSLYCTVSSSDGLDAGFDGNCLLKQIKISIFTVIQFACILDPLTYSFPAGENRTFRTRNSYEIISIRKSKSEKYFTLRHTLPGKL